jgi:hypothetical protein
MQDSSLPKAKIAARNSGNPTERLLTDYLGLILKERKVKNPV